MVPAAYVRLDALPLTPNGKLDRKALPAPDDDAFARQAYEPPQGPVEQALADIWAELLGLERVGRHDNFFELGGHSLLAVRMISRLQAAMASALSVVSLFTSPTLADLALEIGRSEPQQQAPMVQIPRDGVLPLSFAQERLWFLDQLEGASSTYNIPLALRLEGALDAEVLKRSLDRLYARHEALRSVFRSHDGAPRVELLEADLGIPLVRHDLAAEPDALARLAQIGAEEAQTPFDLAQGPLIRAQLVRLGQEEHVLYLTMHHIVSDGWSMGVLVREFNALYAAFLEGGQDPLPLLEVQYPDYAAWQRQWLSGERLEAQADYWRRTLAEAPVLLELPTDRPRPPQQDFRGAYVPIELDPELTLGLKRLAQRHGATLFHTLLAAWAGVLSRLSGQQDVVIGSPSANRGRREIEGLIGFFINTLALRIDVQNDPTVAELLARARAAALGAQDNQDLPFEQVVEIIQPPRRLDHGPLFQVMFAWQNNEQTAIDLPGLKVGPAPVALDKVKFDLDLNLGEWGDRIVGGLGYATALFDAPTIERHRGYLITLLRAMVADDQQQVGRIEILPPEERQLLLEEWNQTQTDYPSHLCVHQLFEQQAERDPEAVALVYEDQTLSYGELDVRANQLAHHLVALGVKPDGRVAIFMKRSPQMVIALLAVLKAGGAYVPLDPAYPAKRLDYLLADSQAPIVLTCEELEEDLPAYRGRVICVDQDWPTIARRPTETLDPKALGLTPANLAYVIYTSGSTGTPKGVMVEHRGVVNYLSWIHQAYELTAGGVTPVNTSFAFDATVTSLLGPLISGGALDLLPEGQDEMIALGKRLQDGKRFSVVKLTPSHMDFLRENWPAALNDDAASALIIGGEALTEKQTAPWRERAPKVRLINEYGPTEATVGGQR